MFSKLRCSYQQVSTEDKNDHGQRLTEKSPRYLRHNLGCIILGFALLCTILVISIIIIESHQERRPLWTSCGNTPEVARQRGCSFDLISFAWQTPECYDSTLVSEFATWNEWTFYTDSDGTNTVLQDNALLGEQSLWVTWYYHKVHCTFMWRQMHRAYERGWIDAHLRAYNHTLHCQKMLLTRGMEDTEVNTMARVIYPICNRVGKGGTGRNFYDLVYSI